jgi:hypothetical protein
VHYRNNRLASAVNDLKRPMLHVALELGVVELAANHTLGIEDSIFRIRMESVLRSITNTVERQSLHIPREYRTIRVRQQTPEHTGGMAGKKMERWTTYRRSSSEKDTQDGVIR